MIKSKISKQLEDFEKKLNSMVDEKDIIAETKKELERIKESGMSREDKIKAQAYLQEFSKSFLRKDIITDKNLSDNEVEGSRLLRVHMEQGYMPNDAKLNTENMKRYLQEPLKYTNGNTRSLNDTFGSLDTELSNEAFSVYSKNGERPTVAFRGSRTSPSDYNTVKDWKFNIESIHNPANAQKSPSIVELESNLEKVRAKYGGFKEMLGYSKGGNHALYYGNKEKVPIKAYNPHITLEHNLSNLEADTTIMRTPLDPATQLLAMKKTGKNLKVKTIPALEQNVEPIGQHMDNNFWDDTSIRSRQNPLKTKLSANLSLRKLREELVKTEQAINSNKSIRGHLTSIDPNSTREQIDEAIKRQTLGSQKAKMKKVVFRPTEVPTPVRASRGIDSGAGVFENVEETAMGKLSKNISKNPQEYLRNQKLARERFGDRNDIGIEQELKDFRDNYGDKNFKALKYRINKRLLNLPDEAIDDDEIKRIYKQEKESATLELKQPNKSSFKMGENTRSFISAKGIDAITPEEANDLVNGRLIDNSNPSMFNSDIAKRYAEQPEAGRARILNSLDKRINYSTGNIYNDYASPMDTALRGTFNQGLKRGVGLVGRGAMRVGGGMLLGAGIGVGVNELAEALHLRNDMSPVVEEGLTGALAGGLTETAGMKLAGEAIGTLSGGMKIGTSALSGGIGIVVGGLVTQGLENMFNKNANPYLKDITSNVIGSEVGYGTGLAVVGIAGGLASAAGVEGGVAAADFWNPVGWGAAIGAAATGIGALIAGLFQGGQEEAEKKKEALEKTEATYAGKADQLREQYQFIRTFMTELGTPNSVIGELNNEMIGKLQNPNITGAMTNKDFQNVFTDYLNKFSLSNFNYSGGQKTTEPQQLQKVLSEQYNSHQSVLNGLVTELNKGGASLTAPASNLYDAQTFTETYNKILNKAPTIAQKLGLKPMTIPADVPDPDLTSSIPSGDNTDQTLGYENTILTNAQIDEISKADPNQYAPTLPKPTTTQINSMNTFLNQQRNQATTSTQSTKIQNEQNVVNRITPPPPPNPAINKPAMGKLGLLRARQRAAMAQATAQYKPNSV
tara:strand:+ start:3967 stop:7194 length:3228 start_codon:yes stop_codon:yes gene_type:complete